MKVRAKAATGYDSLQCRSVSNLIELDKKEPSDIYQRPGIPYGSVTAFYGKPFVGTATFLLAYSISAL